MRHISADHQSWEPGEPGRFTGEVEVSALVRAEAGAGANLLAVRFASGARTHWHAHPEGQVLWIVSGAARVASDTQRVTARPGDVVHIAPGERHWHGAGPDGPMVHLSITTGGGPTWGDPVSLEEYEDGF